MKLKFTQYFIFTKTREDRKNIKEEWILETILNPIKKEVQDDKRIRYWAKISEAENRYLRVIVLEDGVTVHNAFFDRSFKE
ncbi:MAG: hypothetical protein Q8N03_00780 [Ignavibacteria bacterium]|nr:hypothetical protein [Ignavibacteria bacterium]